MSSLKASSILRSSLVIEKSFFHMVILAASTSLLLACKHMKNHTTKGVRPQKNIERDKKNNKQATHNRSLHHRLRLERAFSGIHLQGSNHQREGDIEDQVIEVKTLEQDGSRPLYKTNFQKFDEEGGEVEARLFQKLDEELNKVNAFYKDQVEAAQHEVTLLSKQMEALVALRVKVKSPDTETMDESHQQKDSMVGPEDNPLQQANRNTHYEEQAEENNNYITKDPLEILQHVKVDNVPQSPISTIKKAFTDSSDNELSFSKEELRKVKEQLRLVFVEFYQKLLHLKDYSFMNLSAFSKIMKKYEKHTSRAAFAAYMTVVDNSYVGSSDEVNFLLEKVESTFIRNFTHSNHKKGRKLLRQKTKTERHSTTFFTGASGNEKEQLTSDDDVGVILRRKAARELRLRFHGGGGGDFKLSQDEARNGEKSSEKKKQQKKQVAQQTPTTVTENEATEVTKIEETTPEQPATRVTTTEEPKEETTKEAKEEEAPVETNEATEVIEEVKPEVEENPAPERTEEEEVKEETKETESAPVEEQKQEENKPAETVEETKTEQVSVEKTEA
ncbi:Phosphate transporter PHO1-like 10 [Glycine soja]|uniref:Phosphate transporter PHO1-like 10 n=1 Tax=Glycine soja TaxID=3848 RepID=A0A445IKC2_GLYSO|nr:Phosphate transporter PHO1-like 10 [Glycine soja]